MKILEINSVPCGSTGKIMLGITQLCRAKGHEVYMSSGYTRHPMPELKGKYIKIGTPISKLIHVWGTRFTGLHGCFSYFSTRYFLHKVKRIAPDVIHLHNLHHNYINLPLLFKYIKKHNVKVVWTLHDCWSFTGQCPHFDMIGCDKWLTGCYACPQYKEYPTSFVDRTKPMYQKKKKWFTGVKDLTLVTPSRWLANLAARSFLGGYPVKVIHNGIDLDVFTATDGDFRRRFGCESKFILLGVAFGWGEKKGLDVFIELARRLPERFQIVLVGTSEQTDALLPPNIISVHRTQDQKELAQIYSAADLFVNPTREDTFPTVNIESLACGTPVLTFGTGGSPEMLNESCGCVVPKNDVDAMEQEILRIERERPFSKEACRNAAERFDKKEKFAEYAALFSNEEHI